MDLNRKTWLLWLFFIIGTCGVSALGHFQRTVTHAYRSGALHWVQGLPLYNGTGKGFIYLPHSAILYILFAYLPVSLSVILWCFLSVGLFAYGIYRLTEFVADKDRAAFFFIMSLLTIPIAFSDARNGQMNLIMVALMFIATTMVAKKQWNKTAILLLIGFALKPLTIIFILLYAVLYPRLIWPLILGLIILWLLPFLTQHYTYVWQQYGAAIAMLQQASHVGSSQHTHWAQLFNVLAQFNLIVSIKAQTVMRIVMALATLGLSYYCRHYYSQSQAPFWILTLGLCYLMLFNPRTENNTYAILAPIIGFFAARSWLVCKQKWQAWGLVGLIFLLLFASNIGEFFIPGQHSWVSPLVALVFALSVLVQLLQQANLAENPLLSNFKHRYYRLSDNDL